jgi:chromosome segregation ATPase
MGELQEKNRDIEQYEKSFMQSSRELAIIEGIDKQEQMLKKELKQQLLSLTDQRNSLFNENSELKAQVVLFKGQLSQNNEFQTLKSEEFESHKKKISVLMSQVEEMLSQEVTESIFNYNYLLLL